jgi:MFS transporter, ACS family, tartrate transporter
MPSFLYKLLTGNVGARLWIARIMIGWGVISAAMALTNGPAVFYSLRFLLGIAEAGFFPGIILYLTDWYPRRRRAGIVAWFMMAIAAAGLAAWAFTELGFGFPKS